MRKLRLANCNSIENVSRWKLTDETLWYMSSSTLGISVRNNDYKKMELTFHDDSTRQKWDVILNDDLDIYYSL